MHTQHSLLRPVEFHPRLSGESLHHFLLLLGEGGHGAGGGCTDLDGECALSLIGGGISHKQLIIHDAYTGGKMGPQTTGWMHNSTSLTTIPLPLPLSNQIPSIPVPYLSSRFLGWYLYLSHRDHLCRGCLPASPDLYLLCNPEMRLHSHLFLTVSQGSGQSNPHFPRKTMSHREVM